MKLDCASIQSNQFVHGTSVPEYLLLILNDFSYHVYYYGIETRQMFVPKSNYLPSNDGHICRKKSDFQVILM